MTSAALSCVPSSSICMTDMDNVLAKLIQYLRHQRLVIDYIFVSAIATFIYDYILMLHLEVKLIWFSRWSYTKVLFLLLRYMPFVEIYLALHNQTFSDVPVAKCKVTYSAEAWFSIFQMILAEAISSHPRRQDLGSLE